MTVQAGQSGCTANRVNDMAIQKPMPRKYTPCLPTLRLTRVQMNSQASALPCTARITTGMSSGRRSQ